MRRLLPIGVFLVLAVVVAVFVQQGLSRASAPLVAADHPKRVNGELPAVTLYSTSWCSYCRAARTYFNNKAVAFIERDIEKDPAAAQAFEQLGGGGVPVIVIDNQLLRGFDSGQFKRAYLRALGDEQGI
ncbi:MAG TPA: glutaredoxin family protein [Marinagarivorans sp.]